MSGLDRWNALPQEEAAGGRGPGHRRAAGRRRLARRRRGPGGRHLPLTFATGEWFQAQGVAGFYPEVSVVCEIEDPGAHYHAPLLLSPYGYSTCRGS